MSSGVVRTDITEAKSKIDGLPGDRFLVESIDHVDANAHSGDKFDCVNLFDVDIAAPLYVLFEVPAGETINMELVKRYFQTTTGNAQLRILWDYDVSNLIGAATTLELFNGNNKHRLTKLAKTEISVLNPVVFTNYIYVVSSAVAPTTRGILREPSFIVGSGLGANRSGSINPDVGTRVYYNGTGFLAEITVDTDGEIVLFGYTISENEDA